MRPRLLLLSCAAALSLCVTPGLVRAQRFYRSDVAERVARQRERIIERAERTREQARERAESLAERRRSLAVDREFARAERAERVREHARMERVLRVRPFRMRW
jgi:hypothetical protein